jgi:signal transduction histidine kinase
MSSSNESHFSGKTAVDETIHLLARNYQALDGTVRQLLEGSDQTEFLPLMGPATSRNHSLCALFNWKKQTHRISGSQVEKLLSLVLREIDRHGTIILNLLSSLDREEPTKPKRQPEDLHELLQEVVEVFEGIAAEKGVDIRLDVKGRPVLSVDRQMIYRVFMNLVDNAVKYSYSPTERSPTRYIEIRCRRHTAEGDWTVAVESYGVGILPDEIRTGELFEYGRRGKLAHDRYRTGAGIGLAEARRLVVAHGGDIRIDSRPLHGAYLTTLTVQLPTGRV